MVNVMKWIKRWCFLLALSLLVLPVRAQAAVYEGLDVSVWQGEIDFSQVKAAGKETGKSISPCKIRAFPPAKKWGKTMSFPTLHENLILSKLS